MKNKSLFNAIACDLACKFNYTRRGSLVGSDVTMDAIGTKINPSVRCKLMGKECKLAQEQCG